MKKILMSMAVVALLSSLVLFLSNSNNQLDELFAENIEALAQEESNKCPNKYDPIGFTIRYEQRTSTVTVGIDGNLTIGNTSIPIGIGSIGINYTCTYEIAQCSQPANACCNSSLVGDIKIVGIRR